MRHSETIQYGDACIKLCCFAGMAGAVEYHVIVQIADTALSFDKQVSAVSSAMQHFAETHKGAVLRFARCHISDAATQQQAVAAAFADCPMSIVQQPPLDGSKISVYLYYTTLLNAAYHHRFDVAITSEEAHSEQQTRDILNRYSERLAPDEMDIERDCVRTWFFVRDVDVNYGGVVHGRKTDFEQRGMTPSTHYIASTGIQGQTAIATQTVLFDAYAVKGLQPEQQQYLYARTHLNPTYEYGVTFERGVALQYGDRRHLLISGTASINNKGEVMHPSDIEQQTLRMLENIEALLAEGGSSFADMMYQIVYLRDPADYAIVERILNGRFPDIPHIIVLAPVCRTGWLVEMEGIAISSQTNDKYPAL